MNGFEEFLKSLTIYDYVGIGFILLSVFIGLNKGFISSFGRVVSLFTSFLGAKLLSLSVTEFVYSLLGGRDALYTKIFGIVELQVENGVIELEKTIINTIDSSIIPLQSLKDKLLQDTVFRLYITNESLNPIEDITMKIVETIEPTIIYVLSIALFILLFIVLKIITISLTNALNKLIGSAKVTHGLNMALGGLLGFLKGVSIVIISYYLIFLLITVLGDLPFIDREVFINSQLFSWVSGLSILN